MIEIKDARDSAKKEDAFVRLMWNAQALFGRSYRELQHELSYTEEGWSKIVMDCGSGVAFVFAGLSVIGWNCPKQDFTTFYEDEQVGSAADIADAEKKMRKLFFDFCYDVSLLAADTGNGDLVELVARDTIAIGSMFYTKGALSGKVVTDGKDM